MAPGDSSSLSAKYVPTVLHSTPPLAWFPQVDAGRNVTTYAVDGHSRSGGHGGPVISQESHCKRGLRAYACLKRQLARSSRKRMIWAAILGRKVPCAQVVVTSPRLSGLSRRDERVVDGTYCTCLHTSSGISPLIFRIFLLLSRYC